MPGITSCLAILILAVSLTPAAEAIDEHDWLAHSFVLRLDGRELSGPGATWLTDTAQACQFVLFGEQHYIDEIPRIVAAAYRQLHDDGFDHLGLEMGPWAGHRLSAIGVDEFIRGAPHSIAFGQDAELELMRTAESLGGVSAERFWGLDQASTAIHPLQRLSELGPSWRDRMLARGASLKAVLKMGRYLREDHRHDIAQLRSRFNPPPGSEAALIIDAIEVSNEIFEAHVNGRVDDSVRQRERLMVTQFDAAIARAATDTPRAILKMGGAHLMEGIGPNGVPTLGDHIQRVAETNGLDALHIGIRSFDPDRPGPPSSIFGDADIVIVDTRSLRAAVGGDALATLGPDLQQSVSQFDALLYVRNVHRAASDEVAASESRFRKTMILGVAPIGIAVLVWLTACVHPMRWLTARVLRRTAAEGPRLPWVTLLLVGAGLISVLVLQIGAIRGTSPDRAAIAFSFAWLVVLALIVAGGLSLSIMVMNRRWWSMIQRSHLIIVSLAICILASSMAYWNLGGMLGSP